MVNIGLEALQSAVPLTFIGGFVVQQIVQLLDPLTSSFANWLLVKNTSGKTPNTNETYADYKKWVCTFLSIAFGLAISATMSSSVPIVGKDYIGDETARNAVNWIFLALLIGSGTDGANSLLKYIGYAKDATKSVSSVAIQLAQSSYTVAPKASLVLAATVLNATEPTIEWSQLTTGAGGDLNGSNYVAPQASGTYYVLAKAKADPSATAVVTITVKAAA